MSTKRALLVLSFLFALPVPGLRAEEPNGGEAVEAELRVLTNAIRSNRTAMVAVNLDLTDEEAAAFWPVYERYRKEADANADRLADVISRYSNSFPGTSDEEAMGLIESYLAVDAERAQLRRNFLAEFARVIPGKKVARLYQIENKLDAVIRYDLAATIPVMPE